jgi:hypothetical protein
MEEFECEVNEMAAMSEESSSLKPGGAGGRKKRTVTFMYRCQTQPHHFTA